MQSALPVLALFGVFSPALMLAEPGLHFWALPGASPTNSSSLQKGLVNDHE